MVCMGVSKVKYYKFTDDNGNTTFQSHEKEVNHPKMEEITEEEYISKIEEFRAKADAEMFAAEQSKDERISELEEENAALLYQVLTGEELTDV